MSEKKHIIDMIALIVISVLFFGCGVQNKKNEVCNTKIEIIGALTSSDTTGLLMSEVEFWRMIEKSRTLSNGNYSKQIIELENLLITLGPKQIESFNYTFTALMAASYDWRIWGAAYVINGGCSDDCFHYFRQYLIGHGKTKFYQTVKDPDSCFDWIKSEEKENWEGLQYAAIRAYKEKTNKEIPDLYKGNYILRGTPFDENKVRESYPKLADKF